MAKSPHLTGRELLAALKRGGFIESNARGSHHYLRRDGGKLVVVPVHAGETFRPAHCGRSCARPMTAEELVELL
jgi:predicted RNA binding protein YcfA (HicA-like mRNA interferase family)